MDRDLLGRLRPLERQVLDATRYFDSLQGLQCRSEHGCLTSPIPGLTQGAAQRILDGRDPGHAHRGREFRHRRQRYGRETCGLDLPLRQSDGPATDRSSGHQQYYIDSIFPEVPYHSRHGLLEQDIRAEDV